MSMMLPAPALDEILLRLSAVRNLASVYRQHVTLDKLFGVSVKRYSRMSTSHYQTQFQGPTTVAFRQSINQSTNHLLADRTNGRAYATLLRPSVVCNVMYCG